MVLRMLASPSRKRSYSDMGDGPPGSDTAPSMGGPVRPPFQPPSVHYAMIYLDPAGKVVVSESPSIQEENVTIFTPAVQQSFLNIVQPKIGCQAPVYRSPSDFSDGYNPSHLSPGTQVKRRCSPPSDFAGPSLDTSRTNMTGLRIGDSKAVEAFYYSGFKRLHQNNCRTLGKEWVKVIEPRKQVNHPYKGRDATKPAWWPRDVIHREPDHIKIEPRIVLLIHILHNFPAQKLKEATDDMRRQIKPAKKFMILEEIMKVKTMQDRCKSGEIDASTLVYVSDVSNAKVDKDYDSSSDPEQLEAQASEETNEGLWRQTPSGALTPPSSTTSMDAMPFAAQNHPTQLAGERQPHYPMAEPIGLEASPAFYNAPDYNDLASQNVLRTPVSTRAATPSAKPGFDYMAQSPYSAPSTSEQVHAGHHPPTLPLRSAGQFEGWAPPFRQNIFDSVDYGTAATQPMSQPSVQYQAPPVSASHVQEMAYAQAQGPPNAYCPRWEDRDFRGSSFRTGSLGHPNVMPPPPHFGAMPPPPIQAPEDA